MELVFVRCFECGNEPANASAIRCDKCSGLLEVAYDFEKLKETVSRKLFDSRASSLCTNSSPFLSSGVWRFKEMIHPLASEKEIVSRSEGNTPLYSHKKISDFCNSKTVFLKHEGHNPSGSFKDRGMTVGVTEAKRRKAKTVACASTGNTSASLAMFASWALLRSLVFIPEGKIASGKLAQALAYGSKVVQISGNFDDAMRLVQESAEKLNLYLLNSINPWRIEGQKSIIFETIQQFSWNPPDWVFVPAGNLGNASAFGKALFEMKQTGLIEKIPKIAAIQSEGASPFYELWKSGKDELTPEKNPETIATAIRIGNPVSWKKALKSIKETRGTVEKVTDSEIMDAKAIIDSSGIGCEPASAASVAGLKKLREKGIVKEDEKIVCVLTGNLLKDSDSTVNYHFGKLEGIRSGFANAPLRAKSLDKISALLK